MTKFDLDTAFVRKLAVLLKETGLTEIEYAEGDKRIRCVAGCASSVVQVAPTVVAPVVAQSPVAEEGKTAPAAGAVISPMVGTVYLSPGPGSPPFVNVGDKVKAGDTLLIIEAMKVMNPIKAPKGGTVAEILVSDAKPVEFGEPLVVIA